MTGDKDLEWSDYGRSRGPMLWLWWFLILFACAIVDGYVVWAVVTAVWAICGF